MPPAEALRGADQGWNEQLDKLDQAGPEQPLTPVSLATHSAKRAELLEQIIARLPADQSETWTKMLLDALQAAAEGEKPDGKHLFRLKQFRDAFSKPGANQAIGAYAAFRYLIAENSFAPSIRILPRRYCRPSYIFNDNS